MKFQQEEEEEEEEDVSVAMATRLQARLHSTFDKRLWPVFGNAGIRSHRPPAAFPGELQREATGIRSEGRTRVDRVENRGERQDRNMKKSLRK